MNISFLVNQPVLFTDADLEGRGVGGSETAFINLTRNLARRGHSVEVFSAANYTGCLNDVHYSPLTTFNENGCDIDVLVLFRNSYLPYAHAKVKCKLFWSMDIGLTDWEELVYPYSNSILCMSPFHKTSLQQIYPSLDACLLQELPLGITIENYFNSGSVSVPPKPGNRVIFCSVPERGLAHLARLWPRISEFFPSAELHITSDYSLWGLEPGTESYRSLFSEQNRVYYHGKVRLSKLVELQKSASVMAYPCTFHEGFCLAALECIAAGAVPVTTNNYALPTTVGDSGLLIHGQPGTVSYDSQFVQSVVDLLQNAELHGFYAVQGRRRVLEGYSWNKIAERFEQLCA